MGYVVFSRFLLVTEDNVLQAGKCVITRILPDINKWKESDMIWD